MTWMRMPGQSWLDAAATFVGMWVVMMVAMMLPSLTPVLWRYRQSLATLGERRPARLIVLAGLGYFFVWGLLGMAAFPFGVALAEAEMQRPALAQAVPLAAGMIVFVCGVLQFTAWKARQLACCREMSACCGSIPSDASGAWRLGVQFGLRCCYCCAGLTAILLVIGVMDLRAMAVVMAAITLERLAPNGIRMARAIGAVVLGAGVFLMTQACMIQP